MKHKIIIRLFLFLILFYSLTFTFSQILQININDIRLIISSFNIYAPIFYTFIYLLSLTIPFNPISEFLLINVAVLIFPPHIAILFTFITHCLALFINYFIGKKFGKKILNLVVKEENISYIDRFLKKLTIGNLFIIRFFLPISSIVGADIISYIAGYKKLPFTNYFLASIIPWTIMSFTFFTATSYLSEKSILFYFIPAVLIIGLPIIFFYGYKFIRKNI